MRNINKWKMKSYSKGNMNPWGSRVSPVEKLIIWPTNVQWHIMEDYGIRRHNLRRRRKVLNQIEIQMSNAKRKNIKKSTSQRKNKFNDTTKLLEQNSNRPNSVLEYYYYFVTDLDIDKIEHFVNYYPAHNLH